MGDGADEDEDEGVETMRIVTESNVQMENSNKQRWKLSRQVWLTRGRDLAGNWWLDSSMAKDLAGEASPSYRSNYLVQQQ